MIRFITVAWKFLRGNEGASLVEYALCLMLLATLTIAAMAALGSSLSSVFRSIATSI